MEKHTAEKLVKVIGIIGIILGTLGAVFVLMLPFVPTGGGWINIEFGPIFDIIGYSVIVLFVSLSILYVIASVHLMKYTNWARKYTIAIATISFILTLLQFPYWIFQEIGSLFFSLASLIFPFMFPLWILLIILNVGIVVILLFRDVATLFNPPNQSTQQKTETQKK